MSEQNGSGYGRLSLLVARREYSRTVRRLSLIHI